MALIKCHECGSEVSTEATACPKCGAKPKAHFGERSGSVTAITWVIALLVVLLVLLAEVGEHGLEKAKRENETAAHTALPPITYQQRIALAQQALRKWRSLGKTDSLPEQSAIDLKKEEMADIPRNASEYGDAKRTLDDIIAYEKLVQPRRDALRVAVRKSLAQTVQHEMLMKNMDATVTAEGTENRRLRIRYILVGAPLAEQLQTDGAFLSRCREAGFKSVVLDNGYGKTWTWEF